MPPVTVGDFIEADVEQQVRKASRATIGKLAEMLERQNIDVEDIGKINRINAWQGFMRGEDGEPELIDMVGIQFVPAWADGPQWPVIEPAPAIKLPAVRGALPGRELKVCVVLPDIQIGYYRDNHDLLHPTHDEAALSVALQITKAAKPDLVVMVGDNLDLPEMGRFRQHVRQDRVDRRKP